MKKVVPSDQKSEAEKREPNKPIMGAEFLELMNKPMEGHCFIVSLTLPHWLAYSAPFFLLHFFGLIALHGLQSGAERQTVLLGSMETPWLGLFKQVERDCLGSS